MSQATGAETARQVQEANIFHDVAKALTSSLDLDSILQTIMEKMAEYFRPDNWSLLMVDEKQDELYFAIAVGPKAEALKNLRLKIGEGIAGHVAKYGKQEIVADVRTDRRFARRIDEMIQWETQSIICMPLRSKLRVLGVIQLINVDMAHFGDQEAFFLQSICDYAAKSTWPTSATRSLFSCSRFAIMPPSPSRTRAPLKKFRNSPSPTTAPASTMRVIFIRRLRPRSIALRVSVMNFRSCSSTSTTSSRSTTPTAT